jgi:hypothetical protein
LTDSLEPVKAMVVEIKLAWSGGRIGTEARLVLGRDGRVRLVEIEPGALAQVTSLLGDVVLSADGQPVTPADGMAYLEAVSSSLQGSRLWATEPFEMNEADALRTV